MNMTGTTGPEWGKVDERITIDMANGDVVAREEIKGRSKRWLRRGLNEEQTDEKKQKDILTILRYREWLPAETTLIAGLGNDGCNASGEKRDSPTCETRVQAERPRTLHEHVTEGEKTPIGGAEEVALGESVGGRGSNEDGP